MAKVSGPLNSSAVSGELAGNIWARNQYGPYVYVKPVWDYPDSDNQQAWYNAFKACMTAWKSGSGMTDAGRLMWNEFAQNFPTTDRFGRQIKNTGRQRFIQSSIYRNYAGLSFHWTPPIHPSCRIFPTVTFSQTTVGLYATLNPVLSGDDLFVCSSVINQSVLRNFMPRLTHTSGVFKSTDSHPFLVIPNSDLIYEVKRHFFKWRAVDGDGRPGPQQIYYIDAERLSTITDFVLESDSYIRSTTPSTNYGTATILSCYYDSGIPIIDRTVLKSALSAPGTPPDEALLFVYTTDVHSGGNIEAHALLHAFHETQVTWDDRVTGTPWDSPGCGSGTDYRATATDTVNISTVNTWYSFDLTSLVAEWYNGTLANHGVLLIAPTSWTQMTFAARHNATTTIRPYFQLTWL